MEKSIKKKSKKIRRSSKIKRRKEILQTIHHGQKQRYGVITIYNKKSENKNARFAIVVPSNVGSSVYRNRMKRIIREHIRKLGEVRQNDDFLIKVNPHRYINDLEESIKKWSVFTKKY